MRLYTTPAGEWAGTQSDAKKLGVYNEVDVPTVKAELLAFLNKYKVNDYEAPQPSTALTETAELRELKPKTWDEYSTVRNHLETCDARALNTALTIITGRLGDLLEEAQLRLKAS